jgi:FAD/FMN-containing dehydrogenase
VTIDLDRIAEVEILDGNRARVGGGANTHQVYEALDAHNLSFVGGRVGTVGVGGFTLGGGTSPFSNKYGWAMDNVYEYDLVLSNGTIATASETQNPDLFFALRGGGNNFGIVTAFTVRTFAQGAVSTTRTTYSSNQTEQVLDRVYELFTDEALTSDVEMGYDLYYTYMGQTDTFVLSGTQRYGKPLASPPVFDAINQIPVVSRSNSVSKLSSQTQGSEPQGTTRYDLSPSSVANSILSYHEPDTYLLHLLSHPLVYSSLKQSASSRTRFKRSSQSMGSSPTSSPTQFRATPSQP